MEGVPYRVTVLYTDSMNARITAGGEVSEARDMSTEELIGVVEAARAMAGE